MLLHMRTTIDLPDSLMKRAKHCIAERKLTFRSLVISALEATLDKEVEPFKLRNAAVGKNNTPNNIISNATINDAIDTQRNTSFGS